MSVNSVLGIQHNIWFACLILSGVSDCMAYDVTGKEVLGFIKNRDQIIRIESPKTAAFKVLSEAVFFDPNQGSLLKECSVTWEKDNVYMKIVYNYLQNPVYVPPSSKIYQQVEYDNDSKRLNIARFLETYIISTPEKIEKIDKLQQFKISPNGNVEKTYTNTAKHIFPVKGNVDANFEFDGFFLASGLNFSEYVIADNVELVKMPGGDRIEIKSQGTFGKNNKSQGVWKLTVDPNSNYFVRDASYTAKGFNKPTLEVSTSDIVKKSGIEYARQGHIAFGSSVRDYVNIDITIGDNQKLRQEVNQQVEAPLPAGSQIIDFSGEKPTITTVE